MRRRREPHQERRRRSRFFVLDGETFYVSERDDEQLYAVRLTGSDEELVRRMLEENDVEMESRLLARR
jgi:hypothetical protein